MSRLVLAGLVCSAYRLGELPDADRGIGVVLDAVLADDPRVDAAADSYAP
ncbi:MAG TPA: hypothetical protein VFU34_08385 [Gaiellaceae bacterium]|nr:hypothetical protein [Gaiellaceae bacterium]